MNNNKKFRIVIRIPESAGEDRNKKVYDENEEGEIVDSQYVKDKTVTRYKLVCENDVDTSSLPVKDQHIVTDYIEKGLESQTRAAVTKEVQNLLHEYRVWVGDRAPQDDFEILLHRINTLSSPEGRPLEEVIKEHLVGTTDDDPVIQQMSCQVSDDVKLGRIQMEKKSFYHSKNDPIEEMNVFKTYTHNLKSNSRKDAVLEVKDLLEKNRIVRRDYEGDNISEYLQEYWQKIGGENLFFILTSIDQAGNGSTPSRYWQMFDFTDEQKIDVFLETYSAPSEISDI
jgi:hypothetical protein